MIVPADAVAANETVPVPQTDPGVVLVIEGIGLTVAMTSVLADVHPPTDASTQYEVVAEMLGVV